MGDSDVISVQVGLRSCDNLGAELGANNCNVEGFSWNEIAGTRDADVILATPHTLRCGECALSLGAQLLRTGDGTLLSSTLPFTGLGVCVGMGRRLGLMGVPK